MKTFVVAFGIVEIFIICFLLVAGKLLESSSARTLEVKYPDTYYSPNSQFMNVSVVPDLKKTCDEESDVDDAAARQLSNVTVPQEMGQNATAYANNL